MDIYIEKESSLFSQLESIRIIHQTYPGTKVQVIDKDSNVLETLNVGRLISSGTITPLQPVDVKPVYYLLGKQEYVPIENNKNPHAIDYMGLYFGDYQCTLKCIVLNALNGLLELIEVTYDLTDDGLTISIYHEGKLRKEMNIEEKTDVPWYIHLRSIQESLSLKSGNFTVGDVIECAEHLAGMYYPEYTMKELIPRLDENVLNDLGEESDLL